MNTEERERGLLQFIDEERDRQCRAILADAKARARKVVSAAYRRHRAALHQRVTAERARAESLLRTAAAERATAERRLGESADTELIAAAWPRVEAQLAERWFNPEHRSAWVGVALSRALARLPRGDWLIRCAAGLSEAERADVEARIRRAGVDTVGFQSDADVAAGLIISAGGAVLDMSLHGLLKDRARVEARLLALAKSGAGGPRPIDSAGSADAQPSGAGPESTAAVEGEQV